MAKVRRFVFILQLITTMLARVVVCEPQTLPTVTLCLLLQTFSRYQFAVKSTCFCPALQNLVETPAPLYPIKLL